MNIIKNLDGDKLTVALEGRLDTTTAPEFEAALKEDLPNAQSVVLDFEKLEYISSAGLRVLLTAQKEMGKKGGMVIKNVCPEILEVFEITGFADILTVE